MSSHTPNDKPELGSSPGTLGGALSFTLIASSLIIIGSFLACQYKHQVNKNAAESVSTNPEPNNPFLLFLDKFEKLLGLDEGIVLTNETEGNVMKSIHTHIYTNLSGGLEYLKKESNNVTKQEKTVYCLVAVNCLIFLACHIPKLGPFFYTHFVHHPTSNRYYTLLTSTFVHKNLLHLGLNMAALESFGRLACFILGIEQFLALYLSSGMVATLGRRIAIKALPKIHHSSKLIPSIGASGAIFALIGYITYLFPDFKGSILFIPFFELDLKWMLASSMILDFVGIVRGWKAIDHCAHFIGASFGLLYARYGKDYFWFPVNFTLLNAITFFQKKYQQE